MMDTLGISTILESKFESVPITKDIKLELETKAEQRYSIEQIQKIIIALPFFEEQLNKNDDNNSQSNSRIDVGRSINDKSNSFLSENNEIDCRILADDDLSVSLSKLEIDEKVHLSKVNGEKTNNSLGNDGGIQDCEVIPRGKECKVKNGTKPYNRDVLQNAHAYSNYLPNLPSLNCFNNSNYNPGYRQTCNILKHEDGFSGGTVMIRSPLTTVPHTAPQVINLKHVSEICPSNNSFGPVLYTQSKTLPINMALEMQTMPAVPHLQPSLDEDLQFISYPSCLNSPRSMEQIQSGVDCNDSSLGDTILKEITDISSCLGDSCFNKKISFGDSDLSWKTLQCPSFINSPQSIEPISPGVDDFDLGEDFFREFTVDSSCPRDNVRSLSFGDNTPPYDPLNDIIVGKDVNGEFLLVVQSCDDDSRTNDFMFQRYLKWVQRTEIKTPDKDINAYRAMASLPEEMLTKSDEHGNTLITDVVLKCSPSTFKALLERYKRSGLLSEFVNKKNKSNRTPLHYAVHLCDAQKVRLLVEMGADVNIDVITSSCGVQKWKTESLISHVISKARSNTSLPILIELLCSPKADLMQFCSEGCTPLHTAILCRDVPLGVSKEIIYHLVMRGSDINMQDSLKRTPLSCAAERGHHLVSPLFQAIKAAYPDKHQSMIKSMLQPGFKFLRMAFELHHSEPIAMVELINLLVEHGAELTQKSADSELKEELLRFQGIKINLLTKGCKLAA